MKLSIVGISHRTAPVEVRERVALSGDALEAAHKRAAELGGGEAFIVSTCNRVEVYVGSDEADRVTGGVSAMLTDGRKLAPGDLARHLYVHAGTAALRHLFRVASSLDSMVVGEPQILGQVKDAFAVASKVGTVGPLLSRALPRAFAAAKRVRSETEVGHASASVASAAVELARHIFGELPGKQVLVVGAGEMGDGAARHLAAAGAGPLHVCNRTFARAEELAGRIGATAHPWEELPRLMTVADIILCSTGAPEPIVRRDDVQKAMKVRRGRWLCFIDIAVPRDVDAEVGRVENVYLYDVDALQALVDEHMAVRRHAAEAAEKIVDEEVQRFLAAERSLGVVPTIKALRERFLQTARAEAKRVGGAEAEALAEAIVNKLLHQPLTALKREADSDGLVAAARTLFGITDEEEQVPAASQDKKTGVAS